jgi:LPS O-antigen subunit length determinant protein (WzzB/FepE family)
LGRTIAGQLGGLGGLAGSLLPMGSSEAESVATLKSLAIAEALIRQRDLLPVLFEDRWDASQGAWIVEKPGDEPTVGDGVRLFDRRIRSVDHDRKTGVITVAVEWTDREQAADWANGLVQLANQSLRQRAIDEAQDMLKYLESELGQTSKVELRTSMFQLVEAQQKTLMLANTREEYALRVVDPAVTPGIRDRVRPKRPLIAIAGTAVGGFIGCAIVLLLATRRRG